MLQVQIGVQQEPGGGPSIDMRALLVIVAIGALACVVLMPRGSGPPTEGITCPTVVDVGPAPYGSTVAFSIEIANGSSRPVGIEAIESTCPCTTVIAELTAVAAGEVRVIEGTIVTSALLSQEEMSAAVLIHLEGEDVRTVQVVADLVRPLEHVRTTPSGDVVLAVHPLYAGRVALATCYASRGGGFIQSWLDQREHELTLTSPGEDVVEVVLLVEPADDAPGEPVKLLQQIEL